MIKKILSLLLIKKILLKPLWTYGKPETFDDFLKELVGCVSGTETTRKLEKNFKTNFFSECQELKTCAFSYNKKKNKEYCISKYLKKIEKKCLLKLVELKKENEKEACEDIVEFSAFFSSYIEKKLFKPLK